MKVSALVTAGIATLAVAAPIRIVVVTRIPIHVGHGHDMGGMGEFGKIEDAIAAIRVGHAGSHAAIAEPPVRDIHFLPPAIPADMDEIDRSVKRPASHGGCKGRMHAKFIQISQSMRKALGLPPLAHGDHPRHGEMSTGGFHGTAPDYHILPHITGPPVRLIRVGRPAMPEPMFVRIQQDKFIHRLSRAIGELGPWEGRALSFVLGCGIGVLLRMFFVLGLLVVRARRCRRIQLPTEELTTPVVVVLPSCHPTAEKDPSAFPPEYFVDTKVAQQTSE